MTREPYEGFDQREAEEWMFGEVVDDHHFDIEDANCMYDSWREYQRELDFDEYSRNTEED